LKVLFITGWYPRGGASLEGVFVREHAKAVRLYDDVVVLHCLDLMPELEAAWRVEQETDMILTEGIPTYRVSYRRSPVPKTSYAVYLWSAWQGFRTILAAGFRPDVIHANIYTVGPPALLIGKLSGVPVVMTEHYSAFARKALNRVELRKARFAFHHARVVMPVSAFQQRALEDSGIRADFSIVPNVVNTQEFHPLSGVRPEPLSKKLLYVGSLEPVKGTEYLMLALALLSKQRSDWSLDIIGTGPNMADYQAMAGQLGIGHKVVFHGSRPKSEVAEMMREADLFVLPSTVETFSVATAEALASGLPVLVTDCGGPAEFVKPDVGLIVPPRDPEALCAGLASMLDRLHRYSRHRIAEYAAGLFAPSVVGRRLHNIYESVRQG